MAFTVEYRWGQELSSRYTLQLYAIRRHCPTAPPMIQIPVGGFPARLSASRPRAHDHEEPLTDGRRAISSHARSSRYSATCNPNRLPAVAGIIAIQRNIQKFAAFGQRWMVRRDSRCQHADKCRNVSPARVWIRAHFAPPAAGPTF